jgi:hypothetical protein
MSADHDLSFALYPGMGPKLVSFFRNADAQESRIAPPGEQDLSGKSPGQAGFVSGHMPAGRFDGPSDPGHRNLIRARQPRPAFLSPVEKTPQGSKRQQPHAHAHRLQQKRSLDEEPPFRSGQEQELTQTALP